MRRNELHESEETRRKRSERRREMITELRDSGAVPGIAVGETAPDFTLPNQQGNPVSLSSARSSGPVVVAFYRGSWCPICDTHIRALQQHLGAITGNGATLMAVSPQRPDLATEFANELELGFDVLSDIDQSAIRNYRLQFRLPDDLAAHSTDLGHPIDEQNADGSLNLPVPATFVIDRDGIVRARHVDPNYRTRMTPGEVLDALGALALRSDASPQTGKS